MTFKIVVNQWRSLKEILNEQYHSKPPGILNFCLTSLCQKKGWKVEKLFT